MRTLSFREKRCLRYRQSGAVWRPETGIIPEQRLQECDGAHQGQRVEPELGVVGLAAPTIDGGQEVVEFYARRLYNASHARGSVSVHLAGYAPSLGPSMGCTPSLRHKGNGLVLMSRVRTPFEAVAFMVAINALRATLFYIPAERVSAAIGGSHNNQTMVLAPLPSAQHVPHRKVGRCTNLARPFRSADAGCKHGGHHKFSS